MRSWRTSSAPLYRPDRLHVKRVLRRRAAQVEGCARTELVYQEVVREQVRMHLHRINGCGAQ